MLFAFAIIVAREEGRDHEIAVPATRVDEPISRLETLTEQGFGRTIRSLADLFALFQRPVELPFDGRSGEVTLLLRLPMECQDLGLRESDQRIAALQGMIEECKRMVPGQCRQPEREFGQVDRQRILVNAVKAALGDDAGSVQKLVLIGRNALLAVVAVPGFDEQIRKEAAYCDKESARAHRRVANLEVEYLLGCWVRARALQDWPERGADDRLGKGARRVMGT